MANPPSVARRLVTTALKALVTTALLYLVFRKVPVGELMHKLGGLGAGDIAVLLLLTFGQVTLGVARWWRLVWRTIGKRPAYLPLYGDVLVGLTYNMILPTTVGGDVIRALRARRRVGHAAWATSIYERVAGLVALSSSGAIAASLGLSQMGGLGKIRWIAIGAGIVLLVIFFAASKPFRILVTLLGKRLPRAATSDLEGIVHDLEGPLATAGARLEALGWSALVQAFGIAFVIVGAFTLGDHDHTIAILIGVPVVHVLSMIPISLGGLGLREGLFVGILGTLGVAPGVALGLAAQWLASALLFAVLGAVVALLPQSAVEVPAAES